jgi:hypothetical protein
MITIFKTFNTKTKEVKEYSKPEFGDFGEYILINADDFDTLVFDVENTALFSGNKQETTDRLKKLAIAISITYNKNQFNKNTDHELNTLHNGLFKDCIYTSGDWVGVLQKSFEYKDKIYKVGDIFSGLIVYFGAIYFTNDSGVYRCDTVGFAFKNMYWDEDDHESPFFGLTPYDDISKDTSCIDISRYTYDKNIVDEYFLQKMINL